jgi:hypothetical protein
VDHHANAFFVSPGQCFRFVCGTGGKKGQPYHCPASVVWRGRFVTALGTVYGVWSCDGHVDELKALGAI